MGVKRYCQPEKKISDITNLKGTGKENLLCPSMGTMEILIGFLEMLNENNQHDRDGYSDKGNSTSDNINPWTDVFNGPDDLHDCNGNHGR
jgi:hypothetical protein